MSGPQEKVRQLQEQLQVLKQRYLEELPGKLQAIHALVDELEDTGWERERLETLRRHVHGLVGSGATYGLQAVSIQARTAERVLAGMLEKEERPAEQDIDHAMAHLEELNALCQQELRPNPRKAPDTEAALLASQMYADVPPMRILVVDDDPLIRAFLNALLTARQHHVILADNGFKAIEAYEAEKPDLVIMDAMMPEMNGYEAARAIKQRPRRGFVPIIFLTALDSDEELARCVQYGGDDFLTKPIKPLLLYARIFSMHRIRTLYGELARYKEHTEEEIQLSRRVFDAITQRNEGIFPGLDAWQQSAGHFSGDLFNYLCNEQGPHYLMLGDFTGHGLAAAIGAVPTADVFYTMARKGATLAEIAEEINHKLHAILPTDKFMACILLRIDRFRNSLEVMNSSMPPMLLLGDETRQAEADNLPLGIIGRGGFKASCQHFGLDGVKALVMHTDGLNEAFNGAQEMYGLDRLHRRIADAEPSGIIAAVREDVTGFLAGQPADDDISLVVIDMKQADAPAA